MKIRYYTDKINLTLKESGWYNLLHGFTQSRDFEELLEFLQTEVAEGKRFTPTLGTIFKPFIKTPILKLKSVLLNTAPEKNLMISNGLAFGTTGKTSQLGEFFSKISESQPFDFTLEYLAEQGVLLINSSMTVPIEKTGSEKHREAWQPFITYLLDMLNSSYPDVPIILFGQVPSGFNPLLTSNNGFPIASPDLEEVNKKLELVNLHLIEHGKVPIKF